MHKKIIRGAAYYYTTVREKGKIKSVYLGRDRKEAKRKEAELKGIRMAKPRLQPGLRPGLKSELPSSRLLSPRTWAYFGLAVVIVVAILLGGAIIGNLVLGPDFQEDSITEAPIKASPEGQITAELPPEEPKPGPKLILTESRKIEPPSLGEGYGTEGERVR